MRKGFQICRTVRWSRASNMLMRALLPIALLILLSACGASTPTSADPTGSSTASASSRSAPRDSALAAPAPTGVDGTASATDTGATAPAASTTSATATSDTTTIPAAAQCYVDAVNAQNLDALVGCFAPDGVVIDVSRRIAGTDAIRTWADREVIGGTLQVIESTPQDNGVRLLVQWAPRGSNGWRAYYTFTYQGDRITQADLQYA